MANFIKISLHTEKSCLSPITEIHPFYNAHFKLLEMFDKVLIEGGNQMKKHLFTVISNSISSSNIKPRPKLHKALPAKSETWYVIKLSLIFTYNPD